MKAVAAQKPGLGPARALAVRAHRNDIGYRT